MLPKKYFEEQFHSAGNSSDENEGINNCASGCCGGENGEGGNQNADSEVNDVNRKSSAPNSNSSWLGGIKQMLSDGIMKKLVIHNGNPNYTDHIEAQESVSGKITESQTEPAFLDAQTGTDVYQSIGRKLVKARAKNLAQNDLNDLLLSTKGKFFSHTRFWGCKEAPLELIPGESAPRKNNNKSNNNACNRCKNTRCKNNACKGCNRANRSNRLTPRGLAIEVIPEDGSCGNLLPLTQKEFRQERAAVAVMTNGLKNLISSLFRLRPEDRATYKTLSENQWILQGNTKYEEEIFKKDASGE
jgi:hypothetical protein